MALSAILFLQLDYPSIGRRGSLYSLVSTFYHLALWTLLSSWCVAMKASTSSPQSLGLLGYQIRAWAMLTDHGCMRIGEENP